MLLPRPPARCGGSPRCRAREKGAMRGLHPLFYWKSKILRGQIAPSTNHPHKCLSPSCEKAVREPGHHGHGWEFGECLVLAWPSSGGSGRSGVRVPRAVPAAAAAAASAGTGRTARVGGSPSRPLCSRGEGCPAGITARDAGLGFPPCLPELRGAINGVKLIHPTSCLQ